MARSPEDVSKIARCLIEKLRKEIDSTKFSFEGEPQTRRALLMLASKSLRISDAVCSLVCGGFYSEAFGLSRTSLEAFLVAKYISNRAKGKDPEKRAASYFNFAKAHFYNAEQFRQLFFPEADPGSPQLSEWVRDAEDKTKFPSLTCWQSAYNMAQEKFFHPLEIVNSDGKHYQAEAEYKSLYEETSHFVHAGSLSLAAHNPRTDQFITTTSDDQPQLGIRSVFIGLDYAYRTCIIAGWEFDVMLPSEVQAAVGTFREEVVTDLEALGVLAKRLHK